MPEDFLFDVYRDVPEGERDQAIALMREIVELQNKWITEGDEGAYAAWRGKLDEIEALIAQYKEAP